MKSERKKMLVFLERLFKVIIFVDFIYPKVYLNWQNKVTTPHHTTFIIAGKLTKIKRA
jgi:hypothetical protein